MIESRILQEANYYRNKKLHIKNEVDKLLEDQYYISDEVAAMNRIQEL